MSNVSNKIAELLKVSDKIAEMLNLSRVEEKVEVNLEQLPLEDGTVLEAEKFEAGFSVGVVTPDGVVPAPIGEHLLQDGRTIVVKEEGIIESIIEPQAEGPQAPEQPVAAEEVAPVSNPKRVVESVSKETFFEAIKEVEKHFEAKLSALEVKLSEATKVEENKGIKPQTPKVENVIDSKVYKGIEDKMKQILNS